MQILGKELIKTIALANNSGIRRVFFKIVDNILISFHKVYMCMWQLMSQTRGLAVASIDQRKQRMTIKY